MTRNADLRSFIVTYAHARELIMVIRDGSPASSTDARISSSEQFAGMRPNHRVHEATKRAIHISAFVRFNHSLIYQVRSDFPTPCT